MASQCRSLAQNALFGLACSRKFSDIFSQYKRQWQSHVRSLSLQNGRGSTRKQWWTHSCPVSWTLNRNISFTPVYFLSSLFPSFRIRESLNNNHDKRSLLKFLFASGFKRPAAVSYLRAPGLSISKYKVDIIFSDLEWTAIQDPTSLDGLITSTPKYKMDKIRSEINNADKICMIKFLYLLGRSPETVHSNLQWWLSESQVPSLQTIQDCYLQLNNGVINIQLD